MRRVVSMRVLLAALVVVSLLAPTALCFAGTISSTHQCCKMSESVQEAPARSNECCWVSAPAPNQAAVVTASDQQTRLAAAAIVTSVSAPILEHRHDNSPLSEHSPPGSFSGTILRI